MPQNFVQASHQCDCLWRQFAVVQIVEVKNVGESVFGLLAPLPSVHKRLRLRLISAVGTDVVVYLEVVPLGIERGVYVAKINTLVWYLVAPQDVKIVAI